MKYLRHLFIFSAAAAILCSAVGPRSAQATRQSAGYQGTITMWAQAYNPTTAKQVPGGPIPHHALFTLAAAWEKLHPGVTIKFVNLASGASNQYILLRTLLAGGSAPDIFFFQPGTAVGYQDSWLQSHLILPLSTYLNQPNPYAPSFAAWKDIFLDPWSSYARTGSGEYATVPLNVVIGGIFYNTTITAKLGIHIPPATFAEFVQDTQKAKAAGYGGFSLPNWAVPSWMTNVFGSVFMQQDIQKYATLAYDKTSYYPGLMTQEDWVRAVTKLGYKYSTDPGFVAMMRTMKSWAATFPPGWASANGATLTHNLFTTGKLAFYLDGTWDNPGFIADKLPFTYKTFWFPPVTKATSSMAASGANAIPSGLGGFGGISLAVNGSDANAAKLPLIVNWLQYITAPKQDGMIVNEFPDFLPADHGVSGDPSIANMFAPAKALAKTGGILPIDAYDWLTVADANTFASDTVLYLLGSTSEASYLAQIDALLPLSAKALIAANDKTKSKTGKWDLTKW